MKHRLGVYTQVQYFHSFILLSLTEREPCSFSRLDDGSVVTAGNGDANSVNRGIIKFSCDHLCNDDEEVHRINLGLCGLLYYVCTHNVQCVCVFRLGDLVLASSPDKLKDASGMLFFYTHTPLIVFFLVSGETGTKNRPLNHFFSLPSSSCFF